MGTLREVIEPGRAMRTIAPESSVTEAVRAMCVHHVRALIVGDAVDPVGILCERDVLERVLMRRLDPDVVRVESVMSAPVVSLTADASPEEALEYMSRHHVHQVPIEGDESLIGVVSSTELQRWALAARQLEIEAFVAYVMGR